MQKNTSTFNTLTCFTFLSKSLQDSRLQVLSQIDDRFVGKDTIFLFSNTLSKRNNKFILDTFGKYDKNEYF